MCGIAGFFSRSPVSGNTAASMLAALAQRGPDASNQVLFGSDGVPGQDPATIGLLHSRLSIIDPRPCANQPMSSDDGQVWICYNGEVYDWQDRQHELERAGAVFHTQSDTEFILQGYLAWGIERLLQELRGMFAFAIVDFRQHKVHLARDRMGEKPLVYSLLDGNLAFGSLVRAVLPFVPPDRRGFAPEAIDAYLAHRFIPAPATIFEHVCRLENGHRLEFDLDTSQLKKVRYWHAQAESADWLAELDRAIVMRTVADRPLGLLLSGGIDSSVIASRMSNQHLTRFESFTAAFPGSSMDESTDAADTARALGLVNHPVPVPDDAAGDFARIVADLDQPFADPSCFPTWYLAREVSRHVKVVLVGDGGDELLAGYKRVGKHLRTRWRAGFRLPLPVVPSPDGRHGKLRTELSMPWEQAYALRFSGFTPGQRRHLQGGAALSRLTYWRDPDPDGELAQPGASAVRRLLAIDFANYLPEYILTKTDLCTMAHGLEGRAPFLDHRFYQSMLGLAPAERFTRPAKLVFRKAMHPAVDGAIFTRKKRGFNPPLRQMIETGLADRLVGLGTRLDTLSAGLLQATAVDGFVAAYRRGEAGSHEQMLQLLMLDESLRQLDALRSQLP